MTASPPRRIASGFPIPRNVCLGGGYFMCQYEAILRQELRSTASFLVGGGIIRKIAIAAFRGGGVGDGKVEGRGERL